ncbi:MAG: HAD-IIIA family hydrolase, partial [Planctomycetes bacterium]|nr:HAD-IIIA family hydrolase [Planctomycetota bacterium]
MPRAGTPPRGLLIFDLDGTLIDSGRDIATAINLLRRDYGLKPLSVRTVVSYVGDGLRVLVARSLRGRRADLDEATKRGGIHYREHLFDHTVLYPGVRQGLRRLRRAGYRLALISNKPAASCRRILRHFGLARLFDVVLGGGDTETAKPHPGPLRIAMRRTRIPPARAWMIGDHKTDLEAARRAGIRSVFLTYGIGQLGREKPALRFDSFKAFV